MESEDQRAGLAPVHGGTSPVCVVGLRGGLGSGSRCSTKQS